MRRPSLFVAAALTTLLGAFAGCKDSLDPDWAIDADDDDDDDGAAPDLVSLSAQPGRGGVTFHFAAGGATTGTLVLYVSSNGGASFSRHEGAASPFHVASGTSAATFSAQVALLVDGTEGTPGAIVSAREHSVLAADPPWSLAPEAGARTGYPVAGIGDVNDDGFADIAVASYQWTDGGASEKGKVEIFYGSAIGVGTAPDVTLVGEAAGDHFGAGLASAGDVNGDGIGDLIVGAPDFGANDEGKVYLYFGSAAGLDTVVDDSFASGQDFAYLGRFVGPAGDSTNDGFDEVVVSAPGFDDPISGTADTGLWIVVFGEADGMLYTGDPGDLDYVGPLDNALSGDRYGWAVSARAGDANGDDLGDVLVGAELAEGSQTSEGSAMIFYGDPDIGIRGTGTQSTESGQDGASTGSALSWGDFDGDGYSDALIAANRYDSFNGTDAGIVEAYFGAAGTAPVLPGSPNHVLFGEAAGDRFGESVTSADVDGDGNEEVLVGAAFQQSDRGRIYAYAGLTATGLTSEPFWTWTGGAGEHAGGALANAGDVNGDGLDEVLVGTLGRIEDPMPDAPGAWLFYGLPVDGPRLDLGAPHAVAAGAQDPLFPDAAVGDASGIRSCVVDYDAPPAPPITVDPCSEATLRAVPSIYTEPGVHDVVVTITDGRGLEAAATVQIRVE